MAMLNSQRVNQKYSTHPDPKFGWTSCHLDHLSVKYLKTALPKSCLQDFVANHHSSFCGLSTLMPCFSEALQRFSGVLPTLDTNQGLECLECGIVVKIVVRSPCHLTTCKNAA